MSQRQHTVPKSYLRGFSDPKGQLRAFDRKRQTRLSVSVTDASVVADIYRIPGATEEDEALMVERMLSQKEAVAVDVITRVRKGESAIGSADQGALAEFIGLQWLRTMNLWETVHEVGDWYAKTMLQGLSREEVARRLRMRDKDVSDDTIDDVLEGIRKPDSFRAIPPKGSFLLGFLSTYETTLPLLLEGWRWIVARSGSRPFITSDAPVILIGDTINGHLGLSVAEEVWLPVGRQHAIVMTRDCSLPPVLLGLTSDHVRLINQRIALESWRWLYWHPNDDGLKSIDLPPKERKHVRIKSLGWREKPGGLLGQVIGFSAERPVVPHERLLSGREIVDRRAVPRGLSSKEEVMEAISSGRND